MKITHTTLLAATLPWAAALVAAPVAGAASVNPAKGEVALRRITLDRKYVVIPPSGKAPPISVTVSVRNVGRTTTPATTTVVKLFQGPRTLARDEIPLGRLAPGHASTQIAVFRDVEPQLGLLHAGAKADRNNLASGPLENDIKETGKISVIAKRWTGVMEADAHSPQILGPFEDDHGSTDPEVTFTFSRLDSLRRFFYTVGGNITQTTTFGSSNGCNGSNEGKGSMAQWGADSGLFISRNLKLYLATLRGPLGPPFTVNITCPGSSTPTPMTVKLLDLLTEENAGGGPLAMTPSQRVLHGRGTLGSIITLTYNWNLVADVP